jgi:hypothetical protein
MAAIDIPILRKTTITLPTLAASATLIMPPVAELIDCLSWISAAVLVRVWDETLPNATAKVKVLVLNNMAGPDDPTTVFIGQKTLAEIEINSTLSPAPPVLLHAPVPTPDATKPDLVLGRYLGVYLYLDAGANGLSGTVTLAINLIGREWEP